MASDGSHLLLNYNTPSSWTTPYNLYADRLLNLNLFPDSLYAKQDAWHRSSLQPYGLPLDSRSTYTKTDWATWAAAIATTTETRDAIINGVVRYIGNTGDSHGNPLTDLYWSHNGTEFFLFARCLSHRSCESSAFRLSDAKAGRWRSLCEYVRPL